MRKKDQEENFMRGQNFHNLYKQKLIEKIVEKKERADKVKEQQRRIAEMCNTTRTMDPFKNSVSKGNLTATHKGGPNNGGLNLSSMF